METIKTLSDGCCRIVMKGKFTFADNHSFRTMLEQIQASPVSQIIFQMEQLEFVDSAGLGMLLLARDETRKANEPQIILEGANGQVKKMLHMARFNQYFQLR